MKKATHLVGMFVVTFALLGLWPAEGQAQLDRGYFWADVGPAFTDDNDLERFATEPVSGVELKYDTGVRFSFGGGYRFVDWASVELESGFIANSVKSLSGTSGDLDVSQVPILVNLVLQLPNRTGFVPFIGAGVGGAISILNADDFSVGTTTADGSFSDFVFAYQGFAGLRYHFNERMAVGLYYKYFSAEGPSWEPDVSIGTSGRIAASSYHVQSVSVSFTFRF